MDLVWASDSYFPYTIPIEQTGESICIDLDLSI